MAEQRGYHLDLSRNRYTVFSINIIGVYRRNVLEAFNLYSLDISHVKMDNLNALKGIRLKELKMEGVKIDAPKFIQRKLESFKLKRVILTASDYPQETIAELVKVMEVIDATTMEQVIPVHPADVGSPGSTAP